MRIDFHTHCFPDAIAARAVASLGNAAALMPYTDGTQASLLASMDAHAVDFSVVLSIATNAHQQKSVNDFAARLNGGRLLAFGSVFPDAPDVLDELERIHALGLHGVKFHPEYQRFYVDDEKMKPIYKKISQLGLLTVFHAGTDIGFEPPYHCLPAQLLRAMRWFDAPVVAAHWGGQGCYEAVMDTLCGIDGLYFDISFGYGTIPLWAAKKITEKHGANRLLFGSDSPWNTPSQDAFLLDNLGLSDAETDLIYYQNAVKLLNLNMEA